MDFSSSKISLEFLEKHIEFDSKNATTADTESLTWQVMDPSAETRPLPNGTSLRSAMEETPSWKILARSFTTNAEQNGHSVS